MSHTSPSPAITANTHTNKPKSKNKKSSRPPQSKPANPPPRQQTRHEPQLTPAQAQIQALALTSPPPPRHHTPSPQPPSTSKKPLDHLVGRALVPFFLDDDGRENTEQIIPEDMTQTDWAVGDDHYVPVRQFVDGYFVEAGSLKSNTQTAAPNSTNSYASAAAAGAAHMQTPSQPKSARKVNGKRSNTLTNNSESAAPSGDNNTVRYAAPAFTNSPSPQKVPMPRFLTAKPTTSSTPLSPEPPAAQPQTQSQPTPPPSQPPASSDLSSRLGPSLLHLIRPQLANGSAPAAATALPPPSSNSYPPQSTLPISLLHLIRPNNGAPPHMITHAHNAHANGSYIAPNQETMHMTSALALPSSSSELIYATASAPSTSLLSTPAISTTPFIAAKQSHTAILTSNNNNNDGHIITHTAPTMDNTAAVPIILPQNKMPLFSTATATPHSNVFPIHQTNKQNGNNNNTNPPGLLFIRQPTE